MRTFEIFDHWTKLGAVEAFNADHALRIFRSAHGLDWVKLFAYAA